MKKRPSKITFEVTNEISDGIFRQTLRYWDNILKPCKYDHPDDRARNIELRWAIKLLLEFMEK